MKVEREETIKFQLTLTPEEANWLKGIMQNPHGCTPQEEDEYNKGMRMKFWNALSATS